MHECTYHSNEVQPLPDKFSSTALQNFFTGDNPEKWIQQTERKLWKSLGHTADQKSKPFHKLIAENRSAKNPELFSTQTPKENRYLNFGEWQRLTDRMKFAKSEKSKLDVTLEMMQHRVNQAAFKWACISAKSQREERYKYQNGVHWQVNTYQNMTEIKPKMHRDRGIKPPDRSGEVIQRFTKRSRQRLMRKARTLNKSQMKIYDSKTGQRVPQKKELPLPYFVTLTYHRNMKDPEQAKNDLNTFLQRFRRLSKYFAYVWKMEPQKRGAVHFHLALFVPDEVFPDAWQGLRQKKVEWMRLRVSAAWNEIAEPGDNTHLQAGTNVREVDNWKMFLGYIYKYFEKTVQKRPFGFKSVPEMIVGGGYLIPPYREFMPDSLPFEDKKTGRFWGFSYNLDFEALHVGFIGTENFEKLNDFCDTLNILTFAQFTRHMIGNANRARKKMNGSKLMRKLEHLRNTFEAQKRRYLINKEKIQQGYMLQFEINFEFTDELRQFLPLDAHFMKN